MTSFMKHTSIVSAIALLALGSAGAASAQSYGDDENNSRAQAKAQGQMSDFCAQNPEQCQPRRMEREEPEEFDTRRKRVDTEEPEARKREARSDWEFDADRHERRRFKDARFRFRFGDYWYPEQYWLGYAFPVRYRVGCGEGRLIVRDRGFRRVRTVECQGRTYTYLGRRQGDTFRVLLSARSGRILDIDRV